MSNIKVYLAFYRGRKKVTNIRSAVYRATDWFIRTLTKGDFSHIEIAMESHNGYVCYSSSIRDGGVRRKLIDVNSEKWVLVPIDVDPSQIKTYYTQTQHQKYDLLGAIASTIPFIQLKERQFCSEWVFNAIKAGGKTGWRFSPNDLFEVFK